MDEALNTIERHSVAINERNLTEYLKTIVFPFTYQNYNGVAITINSEADYGTVFPTPWDIILSTEPDWSHTQFDLIEELIRGTSSVAYKLIFRRINNNGKNLPPNQAIWIAVVKEGVWGVQFRHNLGIVDK